MPKQNKILSPEQLEEKITKNVKKEIRKYIYYCLAGIVLIFGGGLVRVYTDAINSIEKLLVERVSREFEQPRIKATVQEVAANEAKSLLLKQIEPQVAKFKKETEESVTETKKLIDSAQAKLNDLTTVIELEDAARFGSRKAYSRLVQLSSNPDSLGMMAKRRALLIQRELLIYRFVQDLKFIKIMFEIEGSKEKSGDELSTSELFIYLERPDTPKEHIPVVMEHIAKKPKNEVFLNSKRILESSDSLPACAATCGILNKILGNKAPFLAFEDWLKICKEELSKEQ